jgi:hypothetical protein
MADEFLSDAPLSVNVDNEAPFEVLSPTKIKLGPVAKQWAQEYGMTLTEMARWLLNQDAQRQAGLVQRNGEN